MSNPFQGRPQYLYWINIPNLKDSSDTISQNLAQTYQVKLQYSLWGLDKSLPTYFLELNETIDLFENLTYSKDTINKLNQIGLRIYLEEPLASYHIQQGYYKKQFHGEFIGNENPSDLRAKELDSILSLINTNGLSNVNVYTCDYNVEKNYPYYTTKMNLITEDRFVKKLFKPYIINGYTKDIFKKKFINLNWRYTVHRHVVASYLYNKDSYISWPHKKSVKFLKDSAWFDDWKAIDNSTVLDQSQTLFDNSPIIIDIPIKQTDPDDEKSHYPQNPVTPTGRGSVRHENSILREMYKHVFMAIVNESRFAQPTGNFSEKTLQPILYKKPFIVVAPPYTLKYLKEEYGFKTFDKYWDESYDTEEIHTERLNKIFKIIDEIQNTSMAELSKIYKDMQGIINHNRMKLGESIVY